MHEVLEAGEIKHRFQHEPQVALLGEVLELIIDFLHRSEEHTRHVLLHQGSLDIPIDQLSHQFHHYVSILNVLECTDVHQLE